MQNIKSIVNRASDKRNFPVLTGLATRYQLLFDNNEKALAEIHQSFTRKSASIEQMPCAVNASWEADIIILGFCINDSQIVQN
jgi:hypothetical protein